MGGESDHAPPLPGTARVVIATRDAGHPLSVQEVSTVLFSTRAQGPMADSETFAHLEHLRRADELRRADTPEGFRYSPIG